MKKALYQVVTTVLVALSLLACGKSSNDNSGHNPGASGPVAGTPAQNCNIPGNTGCTPNVYQQNAPQFQTWQWNNNGFCGCPAGYRAVMNMSWGISCAPDNWFPTSYYYGYYHANQVFYGLQNTQLNSIPQVTYSPATSAYNNSCAQAAITCDIRLNDASGRNANCGNQGTCRATAGGTYMGLCTTGYGVENYGNPYNPYNSNNCQRYMGYYGWVTVCGATYNGYGYGTGNNIYGGQMNPR
jgi:hypothetical protein